MSHIVFDSLRRINSPIENGVFFLTLHGSRAYGTNVEGSDEDFKGFGVPTKNTYFSPFEKIHFEQQEIKNPDTVIYEIRKFFSLLSNLNPNCIEVLFTREEDHIFMSKEGREVLDNRELFLSKRCRWSFSGYAFSQLKHLKTHRDYLLSPMKVPPTRADFGLGEKPEIEKNQLDATMALIQKEVDRINFDFLDYLQEPEKIALRSVMSEMLATFKITSKDRWMSVARSLGFGDNFILLLWQKKESGNNIFLGKKNEIQKGLPTRKSSDMILNSHII
jgi:predicted nucleotidyltransferase